MSMLVNNRPGILSKSNILVANFPRSPSHWPWCNEESVRGVMSIEGYSVTPRYEKEKGLKSGEFAGRSHRQGRTDC